jgi:glycosyltransferase involved in cell wall biosynthesis
VLSLHDLYPYDAPLNFGRYRVRFNRLFLRLCLGASDAVVCSSDFTLKRLRSHVPQVAEKALRIYQSVAIDPALEVEPRAGQLRTQPFLLAVAQHRSNKNLDLLLEAFAGLQSTGAARPNLRLFVIGAEGPETPKLRTLVRQLALEEQVVFSSGISDAELCWLYRRCEALVVPSRVEGFCFPVAEALQCGTPIVCSDIEVLREVGGAGCCFFDVNAMRPEISLRRAIEGALTQPRPEVAPAIRFSPRDIARQYCAVYSRVLNEVAPATRPQLSEDAYVA